LSRNFSPFIYSFDATRGFLRRIGQIKLRAAEGLDIEFVERHRIHGELHGRAGAPTRSGDTSRDAGDIILDAELPVTFHGLVGGSKQMRDVLKTHEKSRAEITHRCPAL
jgi:hypothetical protein